MSTVSERAARLYTAEDLEHLSAQGHRFELIQGELRAMSPAGGEHGGVTKRFDTPLSAFIYEHDLGECFAAETGFIVARDPDTTLAPGWAFIRRDRVPRPLPRGFIPVVPDVVLETRSPGDTGPDVYRKVEQWLEAGVQAVLELDPICPTVAIHRRDVEARELGEEDVFRLDEFWPGLAVPVRKPFPP